jgi:hypothetical protein
MKPTITIAALSFGLAVPMVATADPRVAELCGPGHVNELASETDVRPNPVGFYVASLAEQVGDRDPRIVRTTGATFYLCTRTAATPDMDAAKALLMMRERTVKYLFVPVLQPGAGSSS